MNTKNNSQIKSFFDIGLIHTNIATPYFTGNFNSAFCCCDENLGLFFSIVFENKTQDKEYFICKLNLKNNSYEALSIEEVNLLCSYIENQIEKVQNINFDLLNLQKLDKNLICGKTISKIKNINVCVSSIQIQNDYEKGQLHFSDEILTSKNFCISQTKNECHTLIKIDTNSIKQSKLLNYCLYKDLYFSWSFNNSIFNEFGIIVNCKKLGIYHQFIIQPYAIEMLQSFKSELLSINDMKSPFSALNFIVMKNDIGINKVNIEGYDSTEHIYLVATAIDNFILEDTESFSIGSIRIGEKIELNQKFYKTLEEKCSNKYTLIWTYQQANNHLSAYKLAMEKISNAFVTVCFVMKNSTLISSKNIVNIWDIRNHLPIPRLSNIYYIEDCAWRENIIFIENNSFFPNFLNLNKDQFDELVSEDIEKLFNELDDKNKLYYKIMYAIEWLNNCWVTHKTSDKIISIIMSIEFLLSGEKGNSIIEDYLDNNPIQIKDNKSLSSNDIFKSIISVIESISFSTNKKEERELIEKISNEIKKSLTQSSFNSKLQQLVKRLNIPLEEDCIKLIEKARKIRNDMIHGREIEPMPIIEIKIMCNAVSQIIKYKLDELNKL